jgi:uncharacterized membrane protein YhiD involved in acid resistance
MSVKDAIKKSILESDMYNQAISSSTIITIIVDMAVALLMGLLIYYIYRRFFKGVVYSRNFAMTLVGMTVLTSMVTLAISTNIVISLGMVGALSIVRYRTAVKEPLDLMYLFWAITTGITVGASMYILAVIGAVIMIVFIVFFSRETAGKKAYIVIVHYKGDKAGDEIIRIMDNLKYSIRSYSIRSKVLRSDDSVELTMQVRVKADSLVFTEKIKAMEDVSDVTLLEFNGEYHG